MGAFKKLFKQDSYITHRNTKKDWNISGSSFSEYGIVAEKVDSAYLSSLKQLYYPDKKLSLIETSVTCSGINTASYYEIVSHSFDYYPQTSLYFSQSRELSNSNYLYSIPRDLYGTHIEPGVSINLVYTELEKTFYTSQSYWENNYTDESLFELVRTDFNLKDDGEGNIYIEGSNPVEYVGDIVYPHGVIVITDPRVTRTLTDKIPDSISWRSNHPVFTQNYHCHVSDFEFNSTQNPTALSSSIKTLYDNNGDVFKTCGKYNNGELLPNLTGSEFKPYITTVGLYTESNELVAVAKLTRPIPKPNNTEMTIIVQLDI